MNEKWLLSILYKWLIKEYSKTEILILLEIAKKLLREWLKQKVEDENIDELADKFLGLLDENLYEDGEVLRKELSKIFSQIIYRNGVKEHEKN